MGRKAINGRREVGVDAKLLREKAVQENAQTHVLTSEFGGVVPDAGTVSHSTVQGQIPDNTQHNNNSPSH